MPPCNVKQNIGIINHNKPQINTKKSSVAVIPIIELCALSATCVTINYAVTDMSTCAVRTNN